MNQPYLGQIVMYGFDWAVKNYALCQAQQMAIAQNQALFSILGTTYGGNGTTTFALPDLRGRSFVNWGPGAGPGLSSYNLGEQVGTQSVTLLQNNMAQHNHTFNVNNGAATSGVPGTGVVLSQGPIVNGTTPMYSTLAPTGLMNTTELGTVGSNLPISKIQPYLCLNYSIALAGIFPSRN
jgi:microcystin-dependent protein